MGDWTRLVTHASIVYEHPFLIVVSHPTPMHYCTTFMYFILVPLLDDRFPPI